MAKLSAKQIKALPDSMFGLPKEHKYPMPDEEHVRKAIQFFGYCEESKRAELAKNINRRAKQLGMKLKIQPSSAFYKYADREIIKEGFIVVSEFHIGQMSPIVPLDGKMMEKRPLSKNKSTMDSLKSIWDSSKSIEEKKEATLNITKDHIFDGSEFDLELIEHLNAIDDLCYMIEDASVIYNSLQNTDDSRSAREFNSDNEIFLNIVNNHDLEYIVNQIYLIQNPITISKLLGYVNYTTDFTPDEKLYLTTNLMKWINSDKKIPLYTDKLEIIDSHKDVLNMVNFTEDDMYYLNSFAEQISLKRVHDISIRFLKNHNYLSRVVGAEEKFASGNNTLRRFILFDMASSKDIEGFSFLMEDNDEFPFVKLNNKFWYVVLIVDPINHRYNIILIKIYDPENDQYNQNMINYFQGSTIKFNIIIKAFTSASIDEVGALEAADFNALINGIKISKNGTISLLFDFNYSWKEKFAICKDAIEKSKEEKNTNDYMNNLAFLFSMIAYITKLYIRENHTLVDMGGYDYKDATSTLAEASALFKKEISDSIKTDKKFDFVKYYLDNNFNEKINIFDTDDKKELTREVENCYFINIR